MKEKNLEILCSSQNHMQIKFKLNKLDYREQVHFNLFFPFFVISFDFKKKNTSAYFERKW